MSIASDHNVGAVNEADLHEVIVLVEVHGKEVLSLLDLFLLLDLHLGLLRLLSIEPLLGQLLFSVLVGEGIREVLGVDAVVVGEEVLGLVAGSIAHDLLDVGGLFHLGAGDALGGLKRLEGLSLLVIVVGVSRMSDVDENLTDGAAGEFQIVAELEE